MQKEIKNYLELDTPFYMSFCPDNKYWYDDEKEEIPEPLQKSNYLENIKITDILGNSYDTFESNLQNFNEFIDWLFGTDNDEDDFSFSIQFCKEWEINISIYCFIDFLEFINKLEQEKSAKLFIEPGSGVKFFAWLKNDNKIRFVIQNYGNNKWKNFEYFFDITTNKDVFVKQMKKMITKYITMFQNAIKEYKIHNKTKFNNIRENNYFFDLLELKV